MILGAVRVFLPWLIFFTLTQGIDVPVTQASLFSFALFVLIGAGDLKRRYILNWLSFALFTIVTLNVSYFHYPLTRVSVTASFYSLLSIVAWGSILIKKPFTTQYAKRTVPPQAWKSPLFLRINTILTVCWALIFTTNFGIMLLNVRNEHFWIQYLCAMSLNGIGIAIVSVFPKWHAARFAPSKRIGIQDNSDD